MCKFTFLLILIIANYEVKSCGMVIAWGARDLYGRSINRMVVEGQGKQYIDRINYLTFPRIYR